MRGFGIAVVLALLASAATANDWSWGAEDKAAVETSPEGVDAPSQGTFRDAKAVEVSVVDFNEPLPLEAHSAEEAIFVDVAAAEKAALEGDEERQARFLGLSDTLCDWGIGVKCDKQIKKKGHGYPPSIDSQYGVPSSIGHGYDLAHESSSYSTFNNYDTKIKTHHKKGNKNGGVTDLLSGFLNSYTKPKPTKGYAPSKIPTFIPPPNKPIQTYGAPIQPAYTPPQVSYIAPQPTYNVPKPTYNAPKPTYNAPKPTYTLPQSSYVAPSYSAPKFTTQKPSYIPPTYVRRQGQPKPVHQKVTKIITQTVRPIQEATKVQHLHSHTHVYHGAKVIKPENNVHVDTHNTGYTSHFQKKSDDGALVGNSNINNVNSFGSGSTSFSSGSFNSGIHGSNSNNNNNNNIQHNSNPFNNIAAHGSNTHGSSSGFSSHSTLTTNNQGFQHQGGFQKSFSPSAIQQGFKPSVTIEEMLNQNHIGSFARTIYRTDCQCVSAQYCSSENIIPRNGDFGHLIDARNKKSDVFSNDTASAEIINETVVNGTDDYDYQDTTAVPYTSEEEIEASLDDDSEPTVERRRREVNQTEEDEGNYSDVEGRQLTGYTPGPTGCGAGTVCCKRPVYNPARSLPVCGISHDENIHGRIKTKHEGIGQASFGEYPWQAAILKRSAGEMVYVCGATLVSDQYLITAAHCIKELDATSLKIRLGEWDVRDKSEFYPHIEYKVSGIYTHPEFYEGNLENDISIIRIEKRINFSKYPHIGPACLPTSGRDFTGSVCRITGWGKDGWGAEGKFQAILKETDVPVIRKDVCEQILKGTKLGPTYSLHKGMMCAGGEENKDACKGDGGGPLVCKAQSGEYHLAGVVSWGIGCGERGIPGVYVDVPFYYDWIQSIIRH